MKLSRMNRLLIVVMAAGFLVLSACDNQAKRAKEAVDQKLKPMAPKKTELGVFAVDPAAADRAYISVTVTWNFADASGQYQREFLGYVLKKDGDGWQVDGQPIKFTDDKNVAIQLLQGKPNGKS